MSTGAFDKKLSILHSNENPRELLRITIHIDLSPVVPGLDTRWRRKNSSKPAFANDLCFSIWLFTQVYLRLLGHICRKGQILK